MTKIKLCGLTKTCEIETANELLPEYIGFVFAPKSRRYLAPEHAAVLRETLHPDISAVGVFVDDADGNGRAVYSALELLIWPSFTAMRMKLTSPSCGR